MEEKREKMHYIKQLNNKGNRVRMREVKNAGIGSGVRCDIGRRWRIQECRASMGGEIFSKKEEKELRKTIFWVKLWDNRYIIFSCLKTKIILVKQLMLAQGPRYSNKMF